MITFFSPLIQLLSKLDSSLSHRRANGIWNADWNFSFHSQYQLSRRQRNIAGFFHCFVLISVLTAWSHIATTLNKNGKIISFHHKIPSHNSNYNRESQWKWEIVAENYIFLFQLLLSVHRLIEWISSWEHSSQWQRKRQLDIGILNIFITAITRINQRRLLAHSPTILLCNLSSSAITSKLMSWQ